MLCHYFLGSICYFRMKTFVTKTRITIYCIFYFVCGTMSTCYFAWSASISSYIWTDVKYWMNTYFFPLCFKSSWAWLNLHLLAYSYGSILAAQSSSSFVLSSMNEWTTTWMFLLRLLGSRFFLLGLLNWLRMDIMPYRFPQGRLTGNESSPWFLQTLKSSPAWDWHERCAAM